MTGTPSPDAPTEPSKEDARKIAAAVIEAWLEPYGGSGPDHDPNFDHLEDAFMHALDRFRAAGVREERRALSALLHWFENDPTSIGALAAANHARNVLKGETP